mmetsp:Transcript_30462/g.45965  ORF Transcript_30462/g.45965 Transcript_30462/m.45965 type:complete len:421 (-) Transcript_30462:68-1330(-)
MKSFLAAALCGSVSVSVSSLTLHTERNAAGLVGLLGRSVDDVPTNAEIKEKWDKMDEFLEVMFGIACQWSHGKDVDGQTAEAVKLGKVDYKDAMNYKKSLRETNMQGLSEACGLVVASGQKKCREGCAGRWGDALEKRDACDEKCVTSYSTFEKQCNGKVENLAKVYKMKVSAETARNQCYNGHCKEFPTAWQKASESDMASEVSARCDERCTAEKITLHCQNRWLLQVDFLKSSVSSACSSEDTSSVCFSKQKDLLSSEHSTCSSDGKRVCEAQYTTCQSKGNTAASHKEAEGFCASRRKLCLEQVDENCLSEHKANLDKAEKSCNEEAATAFSKCEDEKLASKKRKTVSACEKDLAPTCQKDCSNKCKTSELYSCLQGLKSEMDPAEMFCADLWKLLHESSDVDPITGDPIVLLAKHP